MILSANIMSSAPNAHFENHCFVNKAKETIVSIDTGKKCFLNGKMAAGHQITQQKIFHRHKNWQVYEPVYHATSRR